jgi:hypothetical protein
MLPADAAPPAAVVIDVPQSSHVVTRPLTNRDGSVVGWTSMRDGNALLIVIGDSRDAGYVMIRTGRVTQLVRGSSTSGASQSMPEIVTGSPTHDTTTARRHVPQPEVIFRTP